MSNLRNTKSEIRIPKSEIEICVICGCFYVAAIQRGDLVQVRFRFRVFPERGPKTSLSFLARASASLR